MSSQSRARLPRRLPTSSRLKSPRAKRRRSRKRPPLTSRRSIFTSAPKLSGPTSRIHSTRNLERALELDPRNLFTLQQLALSYLTQHRYQDAIRIDDRTLTIVPGDPLTRITRAVVILHWKADIKPYQATLATLVAEDPRIAPDVDYPDYALCERTAAAAARALANYPRDGVTTEYGVNCPHDYWEGVVARWEG